MDATAHVYALYDDAARWSKATGQSHAAWEEKAKAVKQFIQKDLWDPETGFVYDAWSVRAPMKRHLAFSRACGRSAWGPRRRSRRSE